MRISTNIARLLTAAAVAALSAIAAEAVSSAPGAASAGACTKRSYPGIVPAHTQNLQLKPKYNSFPPSSGTHYYLPAKFNFYTFPVPQLAVVHNLEHGGVAVSYGKDVPAATVAKMRAWYLRDTNGLLVTRLPELGSKIALTAWNAPPYAKTPPDPGRGWVATCTTFDAAAFTAFVKQHRYKAGERFPKAQLAREQ